MNENIESKKKKQVKVIINTNLTGDPLARYQALKKALMRKGTVFQKLLETCTDSEEMRYILLSGGYELPEEEVMHDVSRTTQ